MIFSKTSKMNVHKLWEYVEYINVNGASFTNEHSASLQNSLTLLQNENHFSSILYWGHIFGIDTDYHVAVGFQKDALKDRKYFYSLDMNNWLLLPSAKKKYKHLALLATVPFRGDPTMKMKVLDESLDDLNPDKCRDMKEENRLAALVSIIAEEAEVCARGQLLKQPDGVIVLNKNFYGLTAPEAKQLKSFVHYRTPQQRWNSNLLTRPDYNYSVDFLDTVDTDIPRGCWKLSLERGGTLVYLRNLYWPGMLYFHKIRSQDSAFVYIGNGRKNLDVPFLL